MGKINIFNNVNQEWTFEQGCDFVLHLFDIYFSWHFPINMIGLLQFMIVVLNMWEG